MWFGECWNELREFSRKVTSILHLWVSESCSVVFDSLRPSRLYSPWNSLGQNTGVNSLSLLQGIFPTQGLNPGLTCCRQILYQLSHKGSPRILEWVAYSFFFFFFFPSLHSCAILIQFLEHPSRWVSDNVNSGSSLLRNRTGVSCIAGGFFTNYICGKEQFEKREKLQEGVCVCTC